MCLRNAATVYVVRTWLKLNATHQLENIRIVAITIMAHHELCFRSYVSNNINGISFHNRVGVSHSLVQNRYSRSQYFDVFIACFRVEIVVGYNKYCTKNLLGGYMRA